MRMVVILVAIARVAAADPPQSDKELAATIGDQRKRCEGGEAAACMELGQLADDEYTVIANGYHHARDPKLAKWAFGHALAVLGPACDKGDARACSGIASVYASTGMRDAVRRNAYLEKGCAAHDAWSCFDRGQQVGRSKSAGVKWYAEGCRLGESEACRGLPMLVLAAFVLDPVPGGAMDAKALQVALDASRDKDESAQHAQERVLANVVVQLWAHDRTGALSAIGDADKAVTDKQKHLHVFAAYIELAAADGVDKPRTVRAWTRLASLVDKEGSKYKTQMLESDYAWADPTPMMKRAEQIAARNR